MSRKDLIQYRGGTAADWAAANPVLANREPGIETDARLIKVGDGVTPWNSLGYLYTSASWGAIAGSITSQSDLNAALDAKSSSASLAATTGSTLVGFSAATAGAVARTAQSKLRETVSVFDFMTAAQIASVLARDAVEDVTVAVQSAINGSLVAGRGELYFPDGLYKISDKLVFPFDTGFRIRGQSRTDTVVRQYANDTQIFGLETTLTHSWEISELRFEYNTQQTASHPNSRAISFGTAAGTQTFFNCQIRRCMFAKCYRSIASAAGQIPVWAIKITDCSFEGNNTGSAVRFTPTPAIGQPKITIENCHLDMGSATESYVAIYNGDNVGILNNEFLNGTAPINAIEMSQCFALISGTKLENYNAGAAGTPVMWSLSSGNYTIENCSCNGLLGTGGTPRFIGGNAQTLTINGLSCSSDMSGGNALAYLAANIPFVAGVVLYGTFTDNLRTYVSPTQPVPKFDSDKRQVDWLTSVGDASVALTAASDRIQYAGTALTAARAITLPNTGLYVGMEFIIMRRAGGAFGLTVTDPVSSRNSYFPPESRGFVHYRYVGFWEIVNKAIYQLDNGWAADTGTAKKTANATYVPGAALSFGAAYVQAEHTATATRMTAVENALRDATQTIKAMKDAMINAGLLVA